MDDAELGPVADFLDRFKAVFERGEESVSFDDPFDQRQVEIGTEGQGLGVHLRAAADEDIARFAGQIDPAQIRNCLRGGMEEMRAAQDDRRSVWQWFAEGL